MIASNAHPLDDLAVYALDALEPTERAAVEAHLTECAACRAELDRHRATLSQMPTPDEPPAHLWDRIASQLPAAATSGARAPERPWSPLRPSEPPAQAPALVVPLDPDRPRHSRHRGRRSMPGAPWLAAVAAAVVLVLGVSVVASRGTSGTDDMADLAEAAAADRDSTIVQLTTAEGDPQARVVLTPEGTGYVLMDELPVLPEGRSYQLWKMNGTDLPISLGVIGDGSADAAAVAVPSDSTSFGISVERTEGEPQPTGPIVADGELA